MHKFYAQVKTTFLRAPLLPQSIGLFSSVLGKVGQGSWNLSGNAIPKTSVSDLFYQVPRVACVCVSTGLIIFLLNVCQYQNMYDVDKEIHFIQSMLCSNVETNKVNIPGFSR